MFTIKGIKKMIRGINQLPYIDLDAFLDIEGFKSLHYKICKGFVKSKYKKEGNIIEPGGCKSMYDSLKFKPLFMAIKEYNSLPNDHEIRQLGQELGEWNNRDDFILFLKLALGGYDPYQFVFLKTEEGGWESRFEEKNWTPDIQYFPELRIWLEQLIEDSVFEYLGRIIFFKAEHDVTMPLHRDLILPMENDYTDHRHEFIHIRPNFEKGFYIWDEAEDKKVFVESHACFFNDQDWHGGIANNKQTYSLRIDGRFTEDFRKKIGIDHLESY